MRLLLVEPNATGHHMALYGRLIVQEAKVRGWKVTLLTTRRAERHPAYELVAKAGADALDVAYMPEITPPIRTTIASLLRVQNAYFESMKSAFARGRGKIHADYVYVVNLDYCDKIMAVKGSPFGGHYFSGMMMNVAFHRSSMGLGPPTRNDRLYELLFRRVMRIRTLTAATVINEPFIHYATMRQAPEYDKIRFVPDAGQLTGEKSKSASRAAFGVDDSAFVVLVYGSLTPRKGIRELLNAVNESKRVCFTVLLAGANTEYLDGLLKEPLARKLIRKRQLVLSSGFHDDQKEYEVFRLADVVWLGYVSGSFGSSGVMYQAGSLRLPVIATQHGMIGWLTDRHNLGLCVDPTNTLSVVSALERLHERPDLLHYYGGCGKAHANEHTHEKFGEAVCDVIQEGASV